MPNRLTWILEVDWDNDGAYSGDNEALRCSKLTVSRGREAMIPTGGEGFEPVRPGKMECTLDNQDGRYDAYNSSSPLYPYVTPGCKFRLQVYVEASDTTYDVMAGYIDDIHPAPSSGGVEYVTLSGVDGLDLLAKADAISELQEDIYIHEALEMILDAAGWADGHVLDSTLDLIPYWWARGDKADVEIKRLEDAGGGVFFIAADGQAKYYNRLRDAAAAISLDEDAIQIGIGLPQPWTIVRNAVRIVVYPRSEQATTDLWQLKDTPQINAGQALILEAKFTYDSQNVPATDVIEPAATTDYTANTAADGSGDDITGDLDITTTILGDQVQLVIENTGDGDGFITLLKVRGKPITTTPVIIAAEDATSIARYQRREFRLDTDFQQRVTAADDLKNLIMIVFADPQAFPRVRLRNEPDLQFGVDLFDMVACDFPSKTIDGNYRAAEITHTWLERTGDLVETTLRLEPFLGSGENYWIFPTEIGISSRFG